MPLADVPVIVNTDMDGSYGMEYENFYLGAKASTVSDIPSSNSQPVSATNNAGVGRSILRNQETGPT
jgi:hypothetical protein